MTKRTGYHHGNLREVLLEAVADIIRKDGLGALSLRGAARRAGVSHGAPAHHFGDLRGLLTSHAIRGYGRLTARFQATLVRLDADGASPLEVADELGVTYVQFAIEERAYFEMMYRHELLDTDDPEFVDARDRTGEYLMRSVQAYQEAGWAPDADPLTAALAVWSVVHGLASLWVTETLVDRLEGRNVDELARATLQLVIHPK